MYVEEVEGNPVVKLTGLGVTPQRGFTDELSVFL
jgi:hypothetical protein